MIKLSYIYVILVFAILSSCVNNKRVIGEYIKEGTSIRGCPYIVHLDSDSTGYYTWWFEIKMKNKGTWSISNDTLMFTDHSTIRQKDRVFIIKRNKLIDEKGLVYKKMNVIQRKLVYRGR